MNARSAADVGGSGSATRSSRRRWIWLGALALVLIGAVIGLTQLLQPERMGAIAIAQAERALGLRIVTDGPATLALWPGLRLRLNGVQVLDPLDDALIATAERVDMALPLRVLWSGAGDEGGSGQQGSGRVGSGHIELMAPTLLLPALQAWLRRGADEGPPAPLQLPAFASAIGVSQGRVQGDGWELRALALELSAIRDGETMKATASTELPGEAEDAPPLVLALELEAIPNQSAAGITLDVSRLSLQVSPDKTETTLSLTAAGDLQLEPPQMTIDMRVQHAGMVALVADRLAADTLKAMREVAEQPLHLRYRGSIDLDGQATLDSQDAARPLRASANPAELMEWATAATSSPDPADAATAVAASPDTSPLPPLSLSMEIDSLPIDGLEVQGLMIEMTAETTASAEGAGSKPADATTESGRAPSP